MAKSSPIVKKSFKSVVSKERLLFNIETIGAIFIILLSSGLIISQLTFGFVLPLFLLVATIDFLISFFYARSGIYSIIFLTFVWERFFTLAPVIIDRQEYKIYLLDIILLGVIFGIVLKIADAFLKDDSSINRFEKYIFYYKKSLKYFLIFIGLTTAHFLIDIFILDSNKSVAFSSLKYYTFYPLLYLVTILLFNKKMHQQRLWQFAFSGGMVIIGFIFYGIINGGGLWTEFTPMSTGGIRILAFTHGFYLTMLWLGLAIFIIKNKKIDIKYSLLLLIWGIGILGSMMRHLWLGIILSVGIFFLGYLKKENFLFIKKWFKYYLPGILALATIIIYISIIFPHSSVGKLNHNITGVIEERITSFNHMQDDSSFSWRGLAWKQTLKEYLTSPVFGLGLGKSVSLETMNYHAMVEIRNIHNSWLVLFVQLGIIVSFVFALFLKSVFRGVLTRRKKQNWFTITVLILTLNYFFLAFFQPYLETNLLSIFFWILLGLVSVLKPKVEIEKKKNNNFEEKIKIPKLNLGRITFKQ